VVPFQIINLFIIKLHLYLFKHSITVYNDAQVSSTKEFNRKVQKLPAKEFAVENRTFGRKSMDKTFRPKKVRDRPLKSEN